MLHYVGIGILGIFVVQVFLKLYGMSCEFFRKKLELFDAVIVLTSFSLDLVFVEGITGEQNEEAIALLIIFLLWRILRIINGIMVTSKKRQDLLIQLQKRARRRAEKKMEYLETDRTWKEREIHNLRDLCTERGATEEDISRCKPRRRTILQKMDTSLGLSPIATLSLGLSMSMAGAGRAVIRTLGTVPGSLDGRQGLQQLLGVPLVPRSGARRSTLGLSGSYQASKKWRRNLLSRKTAKSKVGGDGAAVENSIDITSIAGGQRGDVEEDKTTTRTNGSDYTAIDAVQVDERFEQAAESNANAIVVADGRILGSSSKSRTGSVYLRALIPDFIVHVTGAQEDNKQYDAPELIPDPDPKKEPDRPHNRTNSAERRRRNRHLLGSRNPPPIFSSSLPQLSLARLVTNNNNIVVKNTCNYSLSSIGCSRSSSSNNNNNSNNQLQQVLNRENDERRRQFRLAGSENIDLEIINDGRISEDTRSAGHVVYTNSTTPPAAATTTCASKVDLALSASCGSPPPSSCLSGSSSTQSSELALVENQSRQTPIVDGQKRVLSCQDADGVEWSAAAATGAANETGSVRPKSKRPSVGFWRCSKSQEIQPRENISSATGFKTRHKSIHSMTKSHDFF